MWCGAAVIRLLRDAPVPILDELLEQLVGLGGREILEELLLLLEQPHLELRGAGEVVLLADLDLGWYGRG